MNAALRTLLDGVIDYAGLFPPARLPLDEAARNYANYRREADAWMLRHFVIPVGQLDDLAKCVGDLSGDEATWSLSVLPRRCEEMSQWRASLSRDLEACREFQARQGEAARISALEVALAVDVADHDLSEDDVDHIVCDVAHDVGTSGLSTKDVFLEVPASSRATEIRARLANAISQTSFDGVRIGLKLRTGGLEAAAFPSCEELAEFVRLCHDKKVAWKATAGLHHSLPQVDSATGATMHGFLNLLSAVALADEVDTQTRCKILADQDAANFAFTEDSLSWRDKQADMQQIVAARERFTSFGSCSFDEPREDLEQLGYKRPAASGVSN